jgi:hypothetical protein
MNESNVQPMKRSSIYATFGNYYGEKLYKLLYDCCQGVGSFCYEVLKCLGISDQGDSSKFLNQQGEWVAPEVDCDQVNECLGISENGNESLVLNQKGEWVSNSSGTELLFIKVTIPSSQILTSYTNEVELIPSPGVGYYINVLDINELSNFNSVTYATNTDGILGYGGIKQQIATVQLDFTTTFFRKNNSNYNIESNRPISFWTEDGNPENGNSDLTYYITYQIVAV